MGSSVVTSWAPPSEPPSLGRRLVRRVATRRPRLVTLCRTSLVGTSVASGTVMPEVWTSRWPVLLFEVGLVLLCTGSIGLEREVKQRSAGLRTHMVVGLAVWLLVLTSKALVLKSEGDAHGFRPDPTRILEAVVAGIGFIGAGMVFVSGRAERVNGLTTAATLLSNAAVAAAIGAGLYIPAGFVALLVVLILAGLQRLEDHVMRDDG